MDDYERFCQNCGNELLFDREDGGNAFCNKTCREQYHYKLDRPEPTLCNRTDLGAASELMVVADLLLKGFKVYRSCTPSAPFDLGAYKEGTFHRVEVKTGRINKNGSMTHPKPSNNEYDILAVYFLDINTIQYIPPLKD